MVFGLFFLLVLISKFAAYCTDPTGVMEPEKKDHGPNDSTGSIFERVLLIVVFIHVTISISGETAYSSEWERTDFVRIFEYVTVHERI